MSSDDLVGGCSLNGLSIGLKAEVIKKRKEFDQSKSHMDLASHRIIKPLFTKNKHVKSDKRSRSKHKHNEPNDPETEEILDKSRLCLEMKTRFYEKMNRVENFNSAIKHSDTYLVDFEGKITDSTLSNPSLSIPDENANTSKIANSTEYKKLVSMTKTPEMTEEILKPFNANDHLHYQEAVGKEIRERGVGYFAFSTDEETRRAQMQDIEKIHEETETNIAKRRKVLNDLAAKRTAGIDIMKKLEENLIFQGKDANFFDDELESEECDSFGDMKTSDPDPDLKDEPPPERDEITGREELERQKQKVFELIDSIRESTRKPNIRAWDRGKRTVEVSRYLGGRGEWEEERNPEFAPPGFYTAAKKRRYFDY